MNLIREKKCIHCGKLFSTRRTKTVFCSAGCSNQYYNQNPTEAIKEKWANCAKKMQLARIGTHHSAESKTRISKHRKGKNVGESNPKWVGDKVKYMALHSWIGRILGKPDTCNECGRSGLFGHFIHWSNISGEYHRDLTDWQRLCAKCHCTLHEHYHRWGDR